MDKKRKRTIPKEDPEQKKKTELQKEAQERTRNRQLATKMSEKGRRQLLEKYPPQENVLTAPKLQGRFFPPKQETQRILNREEVKKQVNKLIRDIEKQWKKNKTKWQLKDDGWHKKKDKK